MNIASILSFPLHFTNLQTEARKDVSFTKVIVEKLVVKLNYDFLKLYIGREQLFQMG